MAAVAAAVSPPSFLRSLPPPPPPSPSLSSGRLPSPSPGKTRRSTAVAFARPPNPGGTPTREERDSIAPASDNDRFLPWVFWSKQDDLSYLWKLTAGSVGSGAIIKYGSALFPEITRPNILQALVMIGIPVILSVLLLMKESASKN